MDGLQSERKRACKPGCRLPSRHWLPVGISENGWKRIKWIDWTGQKWIKAQLQARMLFAYSTQKYNFDVSHLHCFLRILVMYAAWCRSWNSLSLPAYLKSSKICLFYVEFPYLDLFLSLVFVRRPLCPMIWSESHRLICVISLIKVNIWPKFGFTFEYWVSSAPLVPMAFRVDSRLLSEIEKHHVSYLDILSLRQIDAQHGREKLRICFSATCGEKLGTQWRRQTPMSSGTEWGGWAGWGRLTPEKGTFQGMR